MHRPVHQLDQIQRWMQTVIMHPDGVEAGILSGAARDHVDVAPDDAGEIIQPSRNLTSLERLEIYANAYFARLLECLREEFPALVHALGEETFNGFAFGYLRQFPSHSYTLMELGRDFPRYLAETRPPDGGNGDTPSWPEFLIDLATVERTYNDVFDGPGLEGKSALQAEELAAISPQRWPDVRLVPAPCLRLLTLRFPVHEYISAVRSQTEAVMPEPVPTYLVVTRRDFVVRRCAVPFAEYELLSALVAGESVGAAIGRIGSRPDTDWESLPANLYTWFEQWSAAAYFQAIT